MKPPRVITAPNPSPLTGPGTNSFLLGDKQIAVIDPGPDIESHRLAILDAAKGGQITHILVTHAHLDHSEGVAALAKATGAQVYGFGPATAGRSATMEALAALGQIKGGEGLDAGFQPDVVLKDGDVVASAEWQVQALHTPGHFAGHLSFLQENQVFCGDIILGWSSTLISPPDGDLADYFRSLAKLKALNPQRLYPAHGAPIEAPAARLDELAQHRRARTAQILAALADNPGSARDLALRIYDVGPELIHAASRNVLAHLIALHDLGAVFTTGDITETSVFYLRPQS